jgi:hypothetical protein
MKGILLSCALVTLTPTAFAQSMEEINRGIRERAAAARQQEKTAPQEAPRPVLNKWQQLAERREGLLRAIASIERQIDALETERLTLDTNSRRGLERQTEGFREHRQLLVRRGELEMMVIDIEHSCGCTLLACRIAVSVAVSLSRSPRNVSSKGHVCSAMRRGEVGGQPVGASVCRRFYAVTAGNKCLLGARRLSP